MRQAQRHFLSLAIIILAVAGGLVLIFYPVSTEETGATVSRNFSGNELNLTVGNAPPNYYASAQVTSGNQVTLIVSVLLGTETAEVFRAVFQAGPFEVSKVSVGNGGTVFLTVESHGGTFTDMSVYARIFHYITIYPYALLGLAVIGFAGLFTLATQFRHTPFGKVAGKILPVESPEHSN